MYGMAEQELEYAQDFYDYLVEEGALEEKNEKTKRIIGGEIEPCEHVEECVASEGDRQNETIEQRNHDQHEQEHNEKHKVTFIKEYCDNHEKHEYYYMRFDRGSECKINENPCDYRHQEDEETCDEEERDDGRLTQEVHMINK
jgi:hypothetical protein